MSEGERPRPQYGEYASPEEQRARIAVPDASDAISSGESLTVGPAPSAPAVADAPTVRRARPVDRILTFALLGYGLVNILVSVSSFLDFPSFAQTYFQILGIEGEFSNIADGVFWGRVASIVMVVGYLVTAWLSIRRLRTGKLTWWVPLVGGAVTHLIVGFCLVTPLMADPAMAEFFGSVAG